MEHVAAAQSMGKVVLDLCAGTGAWSKPYGDAGYTVVLVDLPSDVRLLHLPVGEVHGILAAPPCTHFSVSGARWWAHKGDSALIEGLSVVDACLRIVLMLKPKWWALENPVGRLERYIGRPVMTFNPCDFGDPYTKQTCVWGSFRYPLMTPVAPTEGSKILSFGPSPNRWKQRSRTPAGFALAFFNANP